MATFTNGPSQLAEIKSYEPDFGFLAKVYGTKQEEYDRGFSMVKNLYNSALNGNLSNEHNEAYRKDAFKKLESTLRSVSGADLSQASNIMQAQKLIDPIAGDAELAYDMGVTAYHAKQKAKMEQVRTSTDPKVRETYNDIAAQYIAQGESDLRNAKRGDGSIRSVKPREFVQFEDVVAHLNTAAKDAGLEVKISKADGKGYIITQTNGDIAEDNFKVWAANQLSSPKFQKQFAITGEVQAENAIRTEMQKGLSRTDATNAVAERIHPEILQQVGVDGSDKDKELSSIDNKIAYYDKMYQSGFPPNKPEILQQYQALLKQKNDRKDELANLEDQSGKLQAEGPAYVASDLYNIYANQARTKTAEGWGKARAYANVERDVEPDQKVIGDLNRAQDAQFHNDDMNFKYMQHEYNKTKDAAEFELKKQTLELAKIKAVKADKNAPVETHLGKYTSTEKFNATDILQSDFNANRSKSFNTAFGTQGGLMNLFIPEDKQGKYNAALSRLYKVANGNGKLTGDDVGLLKMYSKKIGYDFVMPKNAAHADAIIQRMARQTYNTAANQLALYSKTGKTSSIPKETLQAFKGQIASMKAILNEDVEIKQNYERIAKVIKNADPDLMEGAKIVGWAKGNLPIYDLSNVSKEGKTYLDNVVSSEYNARKRVLGNSYEFSKLSAAEITNVFSPNMGKAVDENGDEIDLGNLRNMNTADAQKVFGNSMQTSYDPVKKKVFIEMKVTPGNLAKNFGLKGAQTVKIEMPYSSIQGNQSLTRFNKYIEANSLDARSLGRFNHFLTDDNARTMADRYMKNLGFDFDVTASTNHDGKPGLSINYRRYDPSTKKWNNTSAFIPTGGKNDIPGLRKAEERIEQDFNTYLDHRGTYESQD